MRQRLEWFPTPSYDVGTWDARSPAPCDEVYSCGWMTHDFGAVDSHNTTKWSGFQCMRLLSLIMSRGLDVKRLQF